MTLNSPGGAVRGTIALTTTTSADTTEVTFERSPTGAGTWTAISVDNTPPFTAALDTTLLTDGLYDLRAIAERRCECRNLEHRHDAHRQHGSDRRR